MSLEEDYPLDRSLCRHCDFRISREISTEGYALTDAEGESLDDLESFILDTCTLTGMDLDHIVLDCNKFKSLPTEDSDNKKNNLLGDIDILEKLKK